MKKTFSIIGCEHAHIGIFIKEMLEAGHKCAGIYEPRNVNLANAMSEEYQISIASDMRALLDSSVDLIGCAAINNEKIDIIEICEKYGKHVMIDKPAVTSRQGLERLEAVMNRGAIIVGMLLTERFRPSIYTLKKLMDRGELGEIVNIAMRKPHRLTPEKRPKWHFSKEQNGGILIDLFIHDFDLLRWLTGKEIAAADGYMAKNILPEYPDFYDTSSVQVVMEGNILGQLYADWYNPEKSWTWGDCRIFVTGTKGTAELRLEGDPFISKEDLLFKVTHETELARMDLESVSTTITEDFLKRIQGEQGIITHEDILLATKATIDADERVKIIRR